MTKTPRKHESSQNRSNRPNEKCQMQCQLTPAGDRCDRRDVVRTEGRILHYFPNWLRRSVPVRQKSVRIERMNSNLLRHPKEERIVNMKRFVQEGNERRDGDDHQQELRFA